MPSERLNTFHDESGLVTVSVFVYKAPSQQQHFFDMAAEVAEDMVVIGGGGEAVEFPYGALLTASYPNENLSAWRVSSKDHGDTQFHYLQAYAIGLKIRGMSREQLLHAIFINWQESGLGQHPQATATIPGGFRLVSGGFKIDWSGAGNLATASFPSNDLAWTAKSKDHGSPSPANLHVCAIGLRENLPVGQVEVAIDYQESVTSQHPASVAEVTSGFALAGGGGVANWRTQGSLLWRLAPATDTSNQQFAAASKDHRAAESCTITAYALGIKIHPR